MDMIVREDRTMKIYPAVRKKPQFIVWSAFLLGLLMLLALLAVNPVYYRDSTHYLAQTTAFRLGLWDRAFPNWLPQLTCGLGGLLTYLGLAPQRALVLSSGLMMAATVFPVYGFCRFFMARSCAAGCAWLAILIPHLIRYGMAPLTDSARWLFLMLSLYLIFEWTARPRGWKILLLGASYGALALSRTEGVVFVAMLCAVHWFYGAWKQGGKAVNFVKILPSVLLPLPVMLAMVFPRLLQMHRLSGYWVLDSRQLNAVASVVNMLSGDGQGVEVMSGGAVLSAARFSDPALIVRMTNNFFDGFFPLYGVFALIGIYVILAGKRWRAEHTVILLLPSGNLLLHIAMQSAAGRYFLINALFWLPFTMEGLRAVYGQLVRRFPVRGGRAFAGAAIMVGVILVWQGLDNLRPPRRLKELRAAGMLWRASFRENRTPAILFLGRDERGLGCCLNANSLFYAEPKQCGEEALEKLLRFGTAPENIHHWQEDLSGSGLVRPDAVILQRRFSEDFESLAARLGEMPGWRPFDLPAELAKDVRIFVPREKRNDIPVRQDAANFPPPGMKQQNQTR